MTLLSIAGRSLRLAGAGIAATVAIGGADELIYILGYTVARPIVGILIE